MGDLATLGGLVLVVTPVCSPPASFSVLSARPWGLESFYPGSSLALWPSWVSETRWREQDTWGERSLSGHILGWSEMLCWFFWLWFTDYGLLFTVCFNLAPWTGYLPLEEISIWGFSNFLSVQPPLFFCISFYLIHSI